MQLHHSIIEHLSREMRHCRDKAVFLFMSSAVSQARCGLAGLIACPGW